MINIGFPYLKERELKLVNLIMVTHSVPAEWRRGLISPIFKSDDKMNLDNYRGICVISCISKVFFLILNDRLNDFLKAHNIIDKSEIGFERIIGQLTTFFTLKTLVNKHVHITQKGKQFACFVDPYKAYDSVWNDGLFAN